MIESSFILKAITISGNRNEEDIDFAQLLILEFVSALL